MYAAKKELLHSHSSSVVFGGSALDLAGRVVHPEYQRQGLASRLLLELVQDRQPDYLITYTRSPAILRMMKKVSEDVYPIDQNDELLSLATSVQYASEYDGNSYHIDRYDEGGLFGSEDPADSTADDSDVSLKDQFTGLQNIRSALIVVSRVKKGL